MMCVICIELWLYTWRDGEKTSVGVEGRVGEGGGKRGREGEKGEGEMHNYKNMRV